MSLSAVSQQQQQILEKDIHLGKTPLKLAKNF